MSGCSTRPCVSSGMTCSIRCAAGPARAVPLDEIPIDATIRAMDHVDLGVPFCTQVGHTGPLRPSETGRPIPYIDQVALDFPELVIVGGHVGYPWTEEMIAVCRKIG